MARNSSTKGLIYAPSSGRSLRKLGKVSGPTRPLRMRLAKKSERAEIALRITPV